MQATKERRLGLINVRPPPIVFYNASLDLLKNKIEGIINEAKRRSGDPEFDFISLGCGNGYKDACILHSMVNHLDPNDLGQFIYYYPIDVSPFMLMAASTNIFNHELGNLATNKLRVKGLWGDFAYLNAFSGVYEEFNKNNFIAVLGNTIGNECEIDVLNALQDGTFPGDFVLIEYNAQDSAQLYAKDFSAKANIERHWESLLRLDSKATYGTLAARELQRSDAGKSFLAEHTFTTYATDVKFTKANGRSIKELGLALLHSYDRGRIGDKMVEKGFEIISNDVEQGVGLLFARKL